MFGKRTNSEEADDKAVIDAPPSLELWAPAAAKARKTVEQLLLERGQVTEEQLVQARNVQSQTPSKSISQILLTMNAATDAQVLSAVAEMLGLAYETPERSTVDPNAFAMLQADYIRQRLVLPLRFEENRLVVAVTDPNNVFLLDEVKRKLKKDIKTVVTTAADISRVVEQMTTTALTDVKVDEIIKDMSEDDVQVVKEAASEDVTDLAKMGNESPIIRFVNFLIHDAIKQGASDIHIEPKEKALKIRYRIDGVLYDTMNPPHTMHAAIISRLKIMGNLDIAERRLPQDGRIRAVVSQRKVDLRTSTLPCAHG